MERVVQENLDNLGGTAGARNKKALVPLEKI